MKFELFYNVSIHDAVAQEATTVTVSVISRTIEKKPLLQNTHVGFVDTKQLIKNVLTQMPDAKSAIKQQEEYVVALRHSDISARINNEIVGQLRAKVPKANIQQLYRSKLAVVPAGVAKEAAEDKPFLTISAHALTSDTYTVNSASLDENPHRLMHEMIVRQGIDPSFVTELTHRSIPARDNVGGLLRPRRAEEHDGVSPATRLLHHYLFPVESHIRPTLMSDLQDSALVQSLVSEPDSDVEVPVSVVIPAHARRNDGRDVSHFFVKFELINGRTGVAIDTVTKPLDVARHLQLHHTPRQPPRVKVTSGELASTANVEIKQVDPGAHGVRVYKKTVYRAVSDIDGYTLVGTYDVKKEDQSLLVTVDKPLSSPAIYRIVPIGVNGTQGFEYTNVVLKPQRYQQIKAVSFTVHPIDVGVKLETRHLPPRAVAIEFLVRNRTTFEADYRNVEGDIKLIDDAARAADYVSAVDVNVSPDNVYEYAARIIYRDGAQEIGDVELVEFHQPAPGKVDTRIEDVAVEQTDEPNVTFSITTDIVDTDADVVKKLLEKNGIQDEFKDDVAREREFLKSLIAHNVSRVDLTVGKRENFGVVTDTSFSDRDLRKNQAIDPLVLGHRYRYEVVALLRAPETMFGSLDKEAVDPVTKKSYTFSPSKFLHPVTLTRGVVVTAQGLKTLYAKDPMGHGAIGAVQEIEVSFDGPPARVVDPIAARFDKFLTVITWKIQGNVEAVDHFIIMKNVHGVRTLVGKAHSEFTYGNCQYFHPVTPRDEGAHTYIILPVLNDYRVGEAVETNTVIVKGS